MESPAVLENFVTDGHVEFDEWVICTTDTFYLKFLNFLYLLTPKYMAFFGKFRFVNAHSAQHGLLSFCRKTDNSNRCDLCEEKSSAWCVSHV